MKMRNRIVVITGASAGVGRAAAHAFAKLGARIALLARDENALREVANEVIAMGGEAFPIPLDVSDCNAVDAAAQRVESNWGPIEVWVNNAMLTVFSAFDKIAPADFKRATEVTYLGYVWGTMAALRHMRARNRGVIIQVGSALAYRAIPLQAPYCGAKFAIRGFTDAVRCELLHERSRVHLCMVQMPALNTPQFDWAKNNMHHKAQPVPPIFQPEVAAEAIVWAAQHRRREVIVGGSSLKAIVANKLFPGLLDHYLARFGFTSQQSDEQSVNSQNNLWESVAPHSTHGRFNRVAKTTSVQFQLMHKYSGAVGAALLGVGLVCGGWMQYQARRKSLQRRSPHV